MSENRSSNNDLILKVEDLVLYFRTTKGVVQAVDHVDFELGKHRAVVIIGESGCGKSSLAKAILRLLPRNVDTYTGRVYLDGQEIMGLDEETFRMQIRWVKMSLVPQAAMNALNPVLRVSDQVAEALLIHYPDVSKREAIEQVREMFRYVGVPDTFLHRYPFELSGGMRQRVAIAMAMITRPPLIILDEPTSALDVLTQANIMNVLKQIKWETGTSYILITHDVATSSELADDVAVMYAGQVVEMSDAASFFQEPLHPYAKMLMAAVPKLRGDQELEFIPGQPPSLLNPPKGCRFAERCPHRMPQCRFEPPMFQVGDRKVRCWLYESEADGIYGTRPMSTAQQVQA
ncbi:MAG: ABC transporter ATP-binding protein [Chloroflexi bacterium]|nr:ABC transporter ATP-binding protein [Chloroflexota bacterium]